ncbi:MAG: hypothetical protein LBH95_08430 [Oscillospiraceae bacterium]|jgi:hypothetical protein|nr:hypothetical protein [Oscillospiraceae bacterium]
MKKTLVILLAALLVFSTAACNTASPSESPSPSPPPPSSESPSPQPSEPPSPSAPATQPVSSGNFSKQEYYDELVYANNFADGSAVADWSLMGTIGFDSGGMHITDAGKAISPPFLVGDGLVIAVDFIYSHPNPFDMATSVMGLANGQGQSDGYDPRFVVNGGSFQVYQEGAFDGTHFYEHDRAPEEGQFSEVFRTEIIILGDNLVKFISYDKDGNIFWRKQTPNYWYYDDFTLFFEEPFNAGESVFLNLEVYTLNASALPEDDDEPLYSTTFADAASDWTLSGNTLFTNGGLLLDKTAEALSPQYSTEQDLRFVVDFSYSGNTAGETAVCLIGFAKADGERDQYDPKFVVLEAGFQVHQEGAYDKGDHWFNFDGGAKEAGSFSDQYTLEIVVSGGQAWFAVYDENGDVFWRKASDNRLSMTEYTIYLQEEHGIGQSLFTKFEVYKLH